MSAAAQSPDDLQITLRNLRFHKQGGMPDRWWLNGDPVATAFFNALSCTFPAGEKFFMDSVRRFREAVDPPLRGQIAAFIAQEAAHSREHVAFNKLAADHGYPVKQLEARVHKALEVARRRHPVRQLAATCALEHFTAILAHQFLKADADDLAGAPEETVRLWAWHAVEEVEHKAVAFDTFKAVTKDMTALRRYLMRILAMIAATTILFGVMRANMGDLYRHDGLKERGLGRRTLGYLFGKGGLLRRAMPDYLSYFKPGFHPWDHDDRDLLERATERFDLTATA